MLRDKHAAASGDEPAGGDGYKQLIHDALDEFEARKSRQPARGWLNLTRAADYTDLDPVTLCRFIREGTGPESFKIGSNSRRIHVTACDKWIQNGGVLGTEAGRKQLAAREAAKAAHSDAEARS